MDAARVLGPGFLVAVARLGRLNLAVDGGHAAGGEEGREEAVAAVDVGALQNDGLRVGRGRGAERGDVGEQTLVVRPLRRSLEDALAQERLVGFEVVHGFLKTERI